MFHPNGLCFCFGVAANCTRLFVYETSLVVVVPSAYLYARHAVGIKKTYTVVCKALGLSQRPPASRLVAFTLSFMARSCWSTSHLPLLHNKNKRRVNNKNLSYQHTRDLPKNNPPPSLPIIVQCLIILV